jgi:Methyltransferase domain
LTQILGMSQAPKKPYAQGDLETKKFDTRREPYWDGIARILDMGYKPADLIHHAPAFAGELNLGRFLALYEAYKLTLPITGHIAEAGVYIGSGTLFFAKLARLFEPASNTLVLGFDWFEGSRGQDDETHIEEGAYYEPVARVRELVTLQGLDDIVRINQVDLSKDLTAYFEEHAHLQFKLVFLDCGYYATTKHCLEHFWPRITPGGILLLDNYNHEAAPGETRAVREFLPNAPIRAFPFAFMGGAYIVKP